MPILLFIFHLIGAVIVTEAMTELVIKSELFKPLRERLSEKGWFLRGISSCGYCFSFYAALVPTVFLVYHFSISYLFSIFIWLFIQRISNHWHNFTDKHFDKFYSKNHTSS